MSAGPNYPGREPMAPEKRLRVESYGMLVCIHGGTLSVLVGTRPGDTIATHIDAWVGRVDQLSPRQQTIATTIVAEATLRAYWGPR